MEMENLKTRLELLEKQTPAVLKTCGSKSEETIALSSVNILKLEACDEFITENCNSPEILEAFQFFSQTSVESIRMLMDIV